MNQVLVLGVWSLDPTCTCEYTGISHSSVRVQIVKMTLYAGRQGWDKPILLSLILIDKFATFAFEKSMILVSDKFQQIRITTRQSLMRPSIRVLIAYQVINQSLVLNTSQLNLENFLADRLSLGNLSSYMGQSLVKNTY